MNLLNTVETYSNLQPFHTVEESNANTKAIRELHADKMTPATYRVLDVLHRWSCKFPGVCYRSKKNIAEELGISRKTVTRACNILAELGAIVQYETKRHNGDRRQSTNAIVFVRVVPAVPAEVPPECPSINTPVNTPVNTQTLIHTNDTGAPVIHSDKIVAFNPNDKEHLKNVLPDGWYQKASGYAFDASDLYAITGELFKAKKGTDLRVEDYLEEFGEVLRRSFVSLKSGRIDPTKWHAYLFEAFRKTAHLLERQTKATPIFNRMRALFDEPISQEKPQHAGASMDDYLMSLCTH